MLLRMVNANLKYPIGVQSFEKIRTEGYLYVDKTEYIDKLISTGSYYFLSRPRRFGKSLLLSTIEAFFQGKSQLFDGLAIARSGHDWQPHPVFHLDLNLRNYDKPDSLTSILDLHLKVWEHEYGITDTLKYPEDRFANVIKSAFKQTGRKVVILIDEYDKPMVSNLRNEPIMEQFRDMLSAFYGVLKSLDSYIRFGMLTGVSRFGKMSVFSGLNNLNDISMDDDFAGISGITQEELNTYFRQGISALGDKLEKSPDDTCALLKQMYDGYHFSEALLDIYNPFSLLNTFYKGKISSYWSETGTPKFLAELLQDYQYDLDGIDGSLCTELDLKASDRYRTNIVPLLFQSGYLTIKGYDREFALYKMGYPNQEVEQGFLSYLIENFTDKKELAKSDLSMLVLEARMGDADKFMTRLKSFFSGFPYDQIPNLKVHYQNVLYIIAKLIGLHVHTEFKTSDGRIDLLIETDKYVYIIECKLKGTAKSALKQINEKEYAAPFRAMGKRVIKIGAAFDPKKRTLRNWLIEIE